MNRPAGGGPEGPQRGDRQVGERQAQPRVEGVQQGQEPLHRRRRGGFLLEPQQPCLLDRADLGPRVEQQAQQDGPGAVAGPGRLEELRREGLEQRGGVADPVGGQRPHPGDDLPGGDLRAGRPPGETGGHDRDLLVERRQEVARDLGEGAAEPRLQPLDPLRERRVGGEDREEGVPDPLGEVEVAHLGRVLVADLRAGAQPADLLERAGDARRVAGELHGGGVGQELAAARRRPP